MFETFALVDAIHKEMGVLKPAHQESPRVPGHHLGWGALVTGLCNALSPGVDTKSRGFFGYSD